MPDVRQFKYTKANKIHMWARAYNVLNEKRGPSGGEAFLEHYVPNQLWGQITELAGDILNE